MSDATHANTIANIIKVALQEDLPASDVTTDNLFLEKIEQKTGLARVVAKEDLVVSGTEAFSETFHLIDQTVTIDWQFQDGDFVLNGQNLCLIRGPIPSVLKAERVSLNFLGHLSGVATLTRCFVEQIRHTKTKILDTRKTLPGLRALEKKAVIHGGGQNHRMSLSDGVLIKENHIQLAGSLSAAVQSVRKKTHLPIEVEVRTVGEAQDAVKLQVWRILLDNMPNDKIAEALKFIPAIIETEASGNMTPERARQVAELGVDFISVGAITHSAPCADLSLLIEEKF